MNKRLRVAVALAWLACAAWAAPARQIAGGYSDASASDREVSKAARFAVRAEGRKRGARLRLVSVERAEKQVVAGMNYRLCVRVREGRRTEEARAVVYQNLRGRLSLTEYEPGGCAK